MHQRSERLRAAGRFLQGSAYAHSLGKCSVLSGTVRKYDSKGGLRYESLGCSRGGDAAHDGNVPTQGTGTHDAVLETKRTSWTASHRSLAIRLSSFVNRQKQTQKKQNKKPWPKIALCVTLPPVFATKQTMGGP